MDPPSFLFPVENRRMPDLIVSRDERVTTITLNRPDARNAFDGRLAGDLRDAIREAADDAGCRAIVLTGAGHAFCAGADLGYLKELIETQNWAKAGELVGDGAEAVAAIASAPKPVIAAVNGAAAGGGANLALACDIRIASDRASIGQVFNRLGLRDPRPRRAACRQAAAGDRAGEAGAVSRIAGDARRDAGDRDRQPARAVFHGRCARRPQGVPGKTPASFSRQVVACCSAH